MTKKCKSKKYGKMLNKSIKSGIMISLNKNTGVIEIFNDIIVQGKMRIVKYLTSGIIQLGYYLSRPQMTNLIAIITAMVLSGYNGKMSTVAASVPHRSRTSISRFLNDSPWNEEFVLRDIRKESISRIWEISKKTKQPIYVIIDDTICKKTKPSSKAKNTIEGCSWHFSHLEHCQVYGQQFVGVMLRCGNIVLPYAIELYRKEFDSKIEIAKQIIATLPRPPYKGYVLGDSWYSCKDVFDISIKKGYDYIGAVKLNRLVYPRNFKKKGIKISEYAKHVKMRQLDFVTINSQKYLTYTYLGRINGMEKIKIIISFPISKNGSTDESGVKAFISTDIEMNSNQMLQHYTKRWAIEVFFREFKRKFAFDCCQIHTLKGIKRYMIILMLAFLYCGLEVCGETVAFSKGFYSARNEFDVCKIRWIVQQTQQGFTIDVILAALKIA